MKTHLIVSSLFVACVLSLSLAGPPAVFASPSAEPALTEIAAIEASETFTCALTTGGGVKCWGDNFYGQLGDGTINDRNTPWWVSSLESGVTAIATGRFHACALTSEGAVKCWGANGYGQLGNNSNNASHVPVDASNLSSGVTAITAGDYHTCALTSTGAMKCWGRNYYGQLGDNSTTDRDEPVAVSGLGSGVAVISAGENHTCAVTTTGNAKCWGNNVRGQVGDNSTTNRDEPVTVSGLNSGVASVSAGGYHTCARLTNNTLKCWGWNHYGQLGDNTLALRDEPVSVIWLASTPSQVVAGGNHTCARDTDGGVRCWGWNAYGQVGDDTTEDRDTPTSVSGLSSGATTIGVGHMHSCTVMTGGGAKCWGANPDGQLGDGTTTDRHVPTDVVSPKLTFRSAAAYDGWILESNETSGAGGTLDSAATLYLGDDSADSQYRAILHFNTSSLPDTAVVNSAILKLKKEGTSGANPFSILGSLRVDMRRPDFGARALELEDFSSAAGRNNVAVFDSVPVGSWYSASLSSSGKAYISRTGATQFRIYFTTDDNDNNTADLIRFYSGDAGSSSRPKLIIEYYVP